MWGFRTAEAFGAVSLGAVLIGGFLLQALQQMNVSKTSSSELSKGAWRGQGTLSSSLFLNWQSWGLSWQGELAMSTPTVQGC